MAKGQTATATNQATQNYSNINAQGAQTQGALWGQLPAAQQQFNQSYGGASGAYNSFLQGTGSYNPGDYTNLQNLNNQNISTGGYNAGGLANLQNQQTSNISTGGYDPGQYSQLQNQYSNLSATGGLDSSQVNNIESQYNNLATTGGISDATAQAMERQASSAAKGTYATLGFNLARQNAAQGISGWWIRLHRWHVRLPRLHRRL